MQTTQPIMNPRHARRPILGFKTILALQAPARPDAAYAPQHDFLMPNLCPQLTRELAPPPAHAPRGQVRTA